MPEIRTEPRRQTWAPWIGSTPRKVVRTGFDNTLIIQIVDLVSTYGWKYET
jgi:hypothetical protein